MKDGVLLINLGTPSSPNTEDVKAFLKPFLLDRRVVDIHRLLWYPLLNLIILPKRAPIVADIYKQIWMQTGSPLLVHTLSLAKKLQARLDIPVEIGMTYGEPSIGSGIEKLIKQGVTQIKLMPLFPQYSTTTTLAVWDQIEKLEKRHPQIRLTRIENYANESCFIEGLAISTHAFWDKHGKPDALLCSYHGIPERYTKEKQDPYAHTCRHNTQQLANALDFNRDSIFHSYQSRFGKEDWLRPYTDQEIQRLAKSGIKKLDIITPSFACDCLETLHEIQIEAKKLFLLAGGEELRLIPCLNESDEHIEALSQLI